MPLILDRTAAARWLDLRFTEPGNLLRPFGGPLHVYPVHALVNDPRHDSPACIELIPRRRRCTEPRPGHLVRVRHCEHSYPLPDGLAPDTLVKLVRFEPGCWTVEANGRRWEVPMTCVDPGQEVFVAGEWWHESHPLAMEELERWAKWTSNAKSIPLPFGSKWDAMCTPVL